MSQERKVDGVVRNTKPQMTRKARMAHSASETPAATSPDNQNGNCLGNTVGTLLSEETGLALGSVPMVFQ